ncbi:uncharacterized protein LOC120653901 [Panicum virgatum]|nr:uncharacterized protein LOC120653901 [Panicum virgatum]
MDLFPDAVVLVNDRVDDLGLSNKEEPIGRSLSDSVQSKDKQRKQKEVTEFIGMSDYYPLQSIAGNRLQTTRSISEELFVWNITRPMKQTTPNTCVLVAATMCVVCTVARARPDTGRVRSP